MSRLHFEEARTEEQFAALSLIHALGWRTTYTGAIPADFMAREITDDRWVPTFRENLKTNRNQLLLLYDEDIPVCCATFGPARIDAGLQAGTVCKFNSRGYEGWGEIISFYTHPDHKRKGYGTKLMEEVLRRLSGQGYLQVFLFVLRENENAAASTKNGVCLGRDPRGHPLPAGHPSAWTCATPVPCHDAAPYR